MKTKSIAVAVVLCFSGAPFSPAQDAQLGTWKFNKAQPKLRTGAPKTTTGMYEAAGDMVKVTLDGTSFDGKPTHNVWTGKYDGKDYPVADDPNQSTRAYTKVSDHSWKFVVKRDGKAILTGTAEVSADGKTRTVKASGPSADGKKISFTAVYDKM